MRQMNGGYILGVAGAVIGLIGGVIGTYFSIKNTNGPRERAFVVKASVVGWFAVILFLAMMLALPDPYGYFIWIPYAVLLPWAVSFANRTQERIRKEESQNHPVQV